MVASGKTTDADTLLCERCGYVIDGLDEAGACPECGKPIGESLPRRRVGTPWQQRAGLSAWLDTVCLVLFRPRRVWDRVQIRSDTWWRTRAFNLVSINCLVASIVPAVLALLPGLPRLPDGTAAGLLILGPTVFFPTLWVATWFESRGVRFFGAQRGWRVDKDVAWTVCAHAGCAWWLAGVGVYAALAAERWIDPLIAWVLNTPAGQLLPVSPLFTMMIRPLAIASLGFVIGMLAFETLVYFGIRSLRYANGEPRGPQASASHATSSRDDRPNTPAA